MIQRYTGTVQDLGEPMAGVPEMTDWVRAIPFEEWPQQTRLEDGKLRPAMVNDPSWRGFSQASSRVVAEVMILFSGLRATNLMLSVVMPGARIEPHADVQLPEWAARVHVPLFTNDKAWFFIRHEGGVRLRMNLLAGRAYLVNTEREHAVVNGGETPRVHFMFDVTK